MEPRTGKTKVAIDYASILHQKGKCNRVLVACPVAIMDVWVAEIKAHCPFKHTITVWDRRARKKQPELPKWGFDRLDFVIINYDAFSTPARAKKVKNELGELRAKRREDGSIIRERRKGGRFDIIAQFKRWAPQVIICDESHRLKSPSAKKSTAMKALGPVADYRVICTGTAVTKAKRTFDLYMQWKFLNPVSPLVYGYTLATFKERFGQWTKRNGYPQFLRERNPKTLHKLLHDESFAVSRDECFDLPAAFPDVLIPVPLEESADIYDQMAEEMVAKIEEGEYTEASIKLVQNLRFAQISSGIAKTEPTPTHPEGRLVRIGREKLRMLEDLLIDWFDQEEKIVVCARFKGDYTGIAELSRKLKVEPQFIIGGQKREERTAEIEKFRVKSGPALIIVQPQAGAMGIDLRTASTMVWYSMTNSYVDYTQCRDRIALSGKANRYVFLLAEGTYDELQYEALGVDGDVVKTMMASPRRLLRNFK